MNTINNNRVLVEIEGRMYIGYLRLANEHEAKMHMSHSLERALGLGNYGTTKGLGQLLHVGMMPNTSVTPIPLQLIPVGKLQRVIDTSERATRSFDNEYDKLLKEIMS